MRPITEIPSIIDIVGDDLLLVNIKNMYRANSGVTGRSLDLNLSIQEIYSPICALGVLIVV